MKLEADRYPQGALLTAELGGCVVCRSSKWKRYDACELAAASGWSGSILVDQGDADDFLERELQPERFVAACSSAGIPLELRMQPGYDHSYYFIASFMGEHIAHHAAVLCEG